MKELANQITMFSEDRDFASDAIKYWEPRRVYNGVLALVVVGYFVAAWPHSSRIVSVNSILILFLLAVLSNVCYCAAYVLDVFVQMSGLREGWLHWRWLLFTIGTVFAAVVTRFFALGFFWESP